MSAADPREFWLRLSSVRGVGADRLITLCRAYGFSDAVFSADERELRRVLGTEVRIRAFREAAAVRTDAMLR